MICFEINGVSYEGTIGDYVYKIIEAYKKSHPKACIDSYRNAFDGPRGRTQLRDSGDPIYSKHPEYFFSSPININGTDYYIAKIHSVSPGEDIDVFENAINQSRWNCPIKRFDRYGRLAFVNP